jgi:predicted CXXCH cytochrome family protein
MIARRTWLRLLMLIVGIGTAAVMWHIREPSVVSELARYRPADATRKPQATYSGSRACKACHPGAYTSWYKSYHRTMTQVGSKESILAPFDGQVLTANGRTYQVIRKGDSFYVNMPMIGTEGQTKEDRMIRPVVMTTGSHHMQAYWVPANDFTATISKQQNDAFNALCAACHGMGAKGGKAPGLVDARMGRDDIDDAMDLAQHIDLDRKDPRFEQAVKLAKIRQYTGRLHQFPFVYLIKQKRWAHEDHTFLQPPLNEHDPDHGREPYGDNWSDGCDQCHSVRPRFSTRTDRQVGDADVAELGIACEACHGPGRGHIERHRNPVNRYFDHGETLKDEIVNPKDLDHRKASYICAQCHAELVLKEDVPRFKPGASLDSFAHLIRYLPDAPPQWLAEVIAESPTMLNDVFWRDGTIRVAGRKFNGMVLTGCFTKGEMSCNTCHSMHNSDPNDQLTERAKGDAVCLDCHGDKQGDVTNHTHHLPESSGSRCYNCHMPHTTVGLLGLIRSHRIDSPNAQRSADTGRPNACSLCHLDKSLDEVAAHLNRWYDQPLLTDSNLDERHAASIQWLLKGDAVQRATIAWHMSWPPARTASGQAWMAPFLMELLDDPYSIVRFIAGQSLLSLPGMKGMRYNYTASQAEFTRTSHDAMERWLENAPKKAQPILYMSNGQLDTKGIQNLTNQRDDTPVRVNE